MFGVNPASPRLMIFGMVTVLFDSINSSRLSSGRLSMILALWIFYGGIWHKLKILGINLERQQKFKLLRLVMKEARRG